MTKREEKGMERTESDTVVSSDPNDTLVTESTQSESTSSVGNEVEEGTDGGDDEVRSVSGETVGDSSHSVFTDTVTLSRTKQRVS
jgi:hypothetical protein